MVAEWVKNLTCRYLNQKTIEGCGEYQFPLRSKLQKLSRIVSKHSSARPHLLSLRLAAKKPSSRFTYRTNRALGQGSASPCGPRLGASNAVVCRLLRAESPFALYPLKIGQNPGSDIFNHWKSERPCSSSQAGALDVLEVAKH